MTEHSDAILSKLVEQGVVSQEQLDAISNSMPSKTICRCADALHTMLCTKLHDETEVQVGTPICSYYIEEQLEGNHWEKPNHLVWIERAGSLMAFFGLTTEEDLLEVIVSSTKVLRDISADVIILSSFAQTVYGKDEVLNFHQNLWEV